MPRRKKGPKALFFNVLGPLPPSVAIPVTPAAPFVFPSRVVKPATVEIGSVVSFEERAGVLEVDPVAVVAVPGRVVIVDITGVVGFTNGGRCIVAVIGGSGLFVYRCGGGVNRSRCDVYPGAGNAKTDVCIYVYLRIAFGSDEASGYDSGEN